jgi:hypothetical protein
VLLAGPCSAILAPLTRAVFCCSASVTICPFLSRFYTSLPLTFTFSPTSLSLSQPHSLPSLRQVWRSVIPLICACQRACRSFREFYKLDVHFIPNHSLFLSCKNSSALYRYTPDETKTCILSRLLQFIQLVRRSRATIRTVPALCVRKQGLHDEPPTL